MRLATYNVENLFRRPSAMNQANWAAGAPALADLKTLNDLINQPIYDQPTKNQILATMGKHPGLVERGKSDFIRLQEIKDKLIRRPNTGPEIRVNGRNEWVGWFELVFEDLNDVAIMNEVLGKHRAWRRFAKQSFREHEYTPLWNLIAQPPTQSLSTGASGEELLIAAMVVHGSAGQLVQCMSAGCVIVVPVRE